jgi:hypothetical protein
MRRKHIFATVEGKTTQVCMAGAGENKGDVLQKISQYAADWPHSGRDRAEMLSANGTWEKKGREIVLQVSLFICS